MASVKKSDRLLLFEMATPERELVGVLVSVAEFPNALVVTEELSNAMELMALADNVNLQLVRMPHNKTAYVDGTPLVQFTNIQTERQLIRRVRDTGQRDLAELDQYDLELVVVYSCNVEAL